YEGTFIVVSHDREFLDNLTNRIWDIENQALKIHHFGVKDFLKRKMELMQLDAMVSLKAEKVAKTESVKVVEKEVPTVELSYEEKKEQKRLKNKFQNQVSRSEEKISELEQEIAKMDVVLAELDYNNEDLATKTLA